MAFGGAGALAALAGPTVVAAKTSTAPKLPQAGLALFEQDDLNFQISFALGEAAYGAGEVGEVAAAINAIRAAGPSYQTVFDTFMALGARLAAEAQAAEAAGRRYTARARHLRSASYYSQALFFVLGTRTPAAEAAVYRTMQEQWAAFVRLSGGTFERVEIPYRNGVAIPAYFMRPENDGKRRKTVIINNGSDAQFVDVYAYGAATAIERGYNALIFEGPGQGSLLFEKKICFTPDWAGVITPIVDYLLGRSDVDPARIALTGWSMGGNLVIRAASREHRLAAVVSDPGTLDLLASYMVQGGDQVFGPDVRDRRAVWQDYVSSALFTEAQKFTFAKRTEIYAPYLLEAARAGTVFSDVDAFVAAVSAFAVSPEMAAAIRAHVLVTNYELDPFFPGQPEKLMGLLTAAASKTLRRFSVAEGAAYHCAPLAPQVRNEAVFDWLDAVLETPASPSPAKP
ncbi:MAG: alpha/beta hydrolase [Bradyrhizobiaceae bacterium]|nr:alpha/beta hydrolase [Bradyrhizobiaceae bacterium]